MIEQFAIVELMMIAIGFVFLAIISHFLRFFIALKSPPYRRALWTAGLAYILAIGLLAGAGGFTTGKALELIPGALIVYWYLGRDFRASWIENLEDLPRDVKLANDDWRLGLIVAILVAAAIALHAYLTR